MRRYVLMVDFCFMGCLLIFLVEEEGISALAHHLPAG
jgi:hypothetical protein